MAEQQGLPAAPVGTFLAVHALLELRLDAIQHVLGDTVGLPQRLDDAARDDLARADSVRGPVDIVERELVVRHAPVPLEALRRDTGTHDTTERQPLGEAAVVAVQQCCRVRVQGMDLQESWDSHFMPPYSVFAS